MLCSSKNLEFDISLTGSKTYSNHTTHTQQNKAESPLQSYSYAIIPSILYWLFLKPNLTAKNRKKSHGPKGFFEAREKNLVDNFGGN
jgi:hypothetical protein